MREQADPSERDDTQTEELLADQGESDWTDESPSDFLLSERARIRLFVALVVARITHGVLHRQRRRAG